MVQIGQKMGPISQNWYVAQSRPKSPKWSKNLGRHNQLGGGVRSGLFFLVSDPPGSAFVTMCAQLGRCAFIRGFYYNLTPPQVEHEASTCKLSEEQLLYLRCAPPPSNLPVRPEGTLTRPE